MPDIVGLGDGCCGCSVCVSACPIKCIEMGSSAEGFFYPRVDLEKCVGCGYCDSVCPFLNPSGKAPMRSAYAMKSKDDDLVRTSSSGGIFTELCQPVLDGGGVVYGVVMDPDCRSCSFQRADSIDAIASMRGSKYLQSDSRGVFEDVKADLVAGRRVLFSGAPCQANALSLFLGKNRDGLLLVDCVCHGVPSPRLWAKCVADIESRNGAKVTSVNFRCKEVGWRRFGLRAEYQDGVLFQPLDESPYLRMFLRDVCLRESCYACRAKKSREADITIGDFWSIEKVLPEMSDDLGWSLVIARTAVGLASINAIAGKVEAAEVAYENAVRNNPAEFVAVARPADRDKFFVDLDKLGYAVVANMYGMPTGNGGIKVFLKKTFGKARLPELLANIRRVFRE